MGLSELMNATLRPWKSCFTTTSDSPYTRTDGWRTRWMVNSISIRNGRVKVATRHITFFTTGRFSTYVAARAARLMFRTECLRLRRVVSVSAIDVSIMLVMTTSSGDTSLFVTASGHWVVRPERNVTCWNGICKTIWGQLLVKFERWRNLQRLGQ